MTEAVILALIALVGTIVFSVTVIVLVKTVLKNTPARLNFLTAHGKFEVSFDNKADE